MDEISKGDLDLLRLAIAASDRARQVGNHPFGAILAGVEGTVLLEAENTVITTRDPTAHAESNLVTMAHQRGLTAQTLAHTTLYASTEPCPMCSGAIYWGGIGRIVYGLSQERLYQLIGDESGGSQEFVLHCRDVLQHASSSVIVLGPALEDEAARVHTGFWTSA
jgi:tRNA(Arg) A34 adenosine deaminase TadA